MLNDKSPVYFWQRCKDNWSCSKPQDKDGDGKRAKAWVWRVEFFHDGWDPWCKHRRAQSSHEVYGAGQADECPSEPEWPVVWVLRIKRWVPVDKVYIFRAFHPRGSDLCASLDIGPGRNPRNAHCDEVAIGRWQMRSCMSFITSSLFWVVHDCYEG